MCPKIIGVREVQELEEIASGDVENAEFVCALKSKVLFELHKKLRLGLKFDRGGLMIMPIVIDYRVIIFVQFNMSKGVEQQYGSGSNDNLQPRCIPQTGATHKH